MGVGNQLACASLVALFSIALLVTSSLFVETRASRSLISPASYLIRPPL
jgi:hypothetical protein